MVGARGVESCSSGETSLGEIGGSIIWFFPCDATSKIVSVRDMRLQDGSMLSSPEIIHDGAISHFQNFLAETVFAVVGGAGPRGDFTGGK